MSADLAATIPRPSPFQFSPNFTAFVRVIGLITCFLFSLCVVQPELLVMQLLLLISLIRVLYIYSTPDGCWGIVAEHTVHILSLKCFLVVVKESIRPTRLSTRNT
jgi:hypothetical protein